jgi:8-oxo-dGTP diphosphatase
MCQIYMMEIALSCKRMEQHKQQDIIPQLSVDCVVFGFNEGILRVMLLRWKGTNEWSLPGGIIRQKESLDDAAKRVLQERTGLDQIYLRQYHAFGKLGRYDVKYLQNKLGHLISPEIWFERTISVGYLALVAYSSVSPNPDQYSDECRWWNLDEVPQLLFDHNEILQSALRHLRLELSFQPIGINLLAEKFTMPELLRLYESILGRAIDPRNFQKKILKSGIVIKLDEVKTGTAHKRPFLYQFDVPKYKALLEEGSLFFS